MILLWGELSLVPGAQKLFSLRMLVLEQSLQHLMLCTFWMVPKAGELMGEFSLGVFCGNEKKSSVKCPVETHLVMVSSV